MARSVEMAGSVQRKQKLRVLFVNHTAVLSGGELAMLEFIKHVDPNVVECSVVLCSRGPLADALEKLVPVHIMPLSTAVLNTRKDTLSGVSVSLLRNLFICVPFIVRLVMFIKRYKPDVIHTNSLKADCLGGIAGRLSGVPVLWHVRDRIEPDYLPSPAVKLLRFACRMLPRVVVGCSQSVLDSLHLPSNKPKFVVYSGIDLNKFHTELSGHAQRSSLITRVGLVGRLAPWKGQHVFIDAAKRLRERYPQLRFLVIGSAMFGEEAYEQELHRQVNENGLGETVEFLGFIRHVEAEIMKLDVLVHASTSPEPFGQTIIQGMAAGKPVIATRGGGASEIISDGVNGLLIEGDNSLLLDAALTRIFEDPILFQQLAKQGRCRVEEKFTIQHTVRALSRALSEACGTK